MKYLDWNKDKNALLKKERGIGFEDIQSEVESGRVLDVIPNPNLLKYPNQMVFIVEIEDYIYLVPFVEDEEKFFLKTIFASRKLTKKYLKKEISK